MVGKGLQPSSDLKNKPVKKGRRGSVKNKARLDAFKKNGGVGNAEWDSCDPALMHAVVCAITRLGGAATLGLSRDQGAHSLTLLLDSQRETLWFNGDANLDEHLREVLGVIESM